MLMLLKVIQWCCNFDGNTNRKILIALHFMNGSHRFDTVFSKCSQLYYIVISNAAFDGPLNFAFQIAHFSYRTLTYRFLLCYLVSSASLIHYYLVHYWRYFSLFSIYQKHSIIEKTDNKKYTFKSTVNEL